MLSTQPVYVVSLMWHIKDITYTSCVDGILLFPL
jgi:hypothetical protein